MMRHFSIVGSGRCGSTWIAKVLRQHPAIALTSEAGVLEFLHFSANLAGLPRFEQAGFPPHEGQPVVGLLSDPLRDAWAAYFAREAVRMAEGFYRDVVPGGRRASWWGDKLLDPRVALDLQHWLEDARFLVLVRDPRDVLCSWRAFARKNATEQVRRAVHADLEAGPLARSWRAIYEDGAPRLRQAVTLRYEDVVEAPREHLGRVLDFLGLEWSAAMDDHLASERLGRRHGTSGTAAASVGRWRGELDADDVRTIEEICAAPMATWGYAPAAT